MDGQELTLNGTVLQTASVGGSADGAAALAPLATAEVAAAGATAVSDVAAPKLTAAPDVLAPVPDIDAPPLAPTRRPFEGREAQIFDSRTWARVRLLADAVMLCTASSIALVASGSADARADRWLAAAFPLLTLALFCAGRNPDERLRVSALDAVVHVLGVISLSTVATVAVGSIIHSAHPVTFAVRLWLVAVVAVGVARVALLSYRRYALVSGAVATPTLIVGAGVVGVRLAMRLFADPGYGLRPVGFLDTTPMPRQDNVRTPLVPVLGGPGDLTEAITDTGARHVILAFTTEPDHVLVDKVKECQALGIEVSLVPRMYEAMNERVALDHVGGLPLLSLRRTDPRSWQFGIKHTVDRLVGAAALLAVAPLMGLIALAVRLSSPGPVLFRQRRVGRDGREFDVLKFRTMRQDDPADGFIPPEGCAPGGVEGMDRRTRIGRWLRDTSLDELPQLLNVLRGEMSLVGPRPERPEFVARFEAEIDHYGDRHRVKSGITGWAQVNGLRGQTSIADRVEWDNYYIENWSLWFDLRIMLLTVAEVLRLRDSALCETDK